MCTRSAVRAERLSSQQALWRKWLCEGQVAEHLKLGPFSRLNTPGMKAHSDGLLLLETFNNCWTRLFLHAVHLCTLFKANCGL